MKDQNSLDENETKKQKWDRAHALFLESLMKPDDKLRGCAHNQKCFHELMEIKDEVIEIVKDIANPHTPPLPFGSKNDVATPVNEHGISKVVISGALKDYYQSLGESS
jgi:hypothetical protein